MKRLIWIGDRGLTEGLFSPIRLRGLELQNRIVVAPMCQYSAVDGCANDWHLMHIGNLVVSGFGLVVVEATAVEPRGRITDGCLGIYNDECEAALRHVVQFAKANSGAAVGLQLAHAGRKASMTRPWQGHMPLPQRNGGWRTIAPSPKSAYPDSPAPRALTEGAMESLLDSFVAAARRAERAGVDLLELHCAHGYLLHQFLSPLANARDDRYGGTLSNRMRFPLSVFSAIRDVWPSTKPLGVRVSACDYVEGGWTVQETALFARVLQSAGCDFVDVSGGGIAPHQKMAITPPNQLSHLVHLRRQVSMPIMSVGLAGDARLADEAVRAGHADLVAIGRAALHDPRWAWHAAHELGVSLRYPDQYMRCAPERWPQPAASGSCSCVIDTQSAR